VSFLASYSPAFPTFHALSRPAFLTSTMLTKTNTPWQWSTNLTLVSQLVFSAFVVAMGIKNVLAVPVTALNLNPGTQSCLDMPSYRYIYPSHSVIFQNERKVDRIYSFRHSLASIVLSGIFILVHLVVMSYPFRSAHFWITLYINLYSLIFSASLCVSGGIVLRPLLNSDIGYTDCQSEISDKSIVGATGALS
jgi:hypothetical protein